MPSRVEARLGGRYAQRLDSANGYISFKDLSHRMKMLNKNLKAQEAKATEIFFARRESFSPKRCRK